MKAAIRKVRNGRVKVRGRWWVPGRPEDGPCTLEGKFVFGLYRDIGMAPMICLWGSEEMYRAKTDEEMDAAHRNFIELVATPEGYIKWDFWHEA